MEPPPSSTHDDEEISRAALAKETEHFQISYERIQAPLLVDWHDGDPENPRNWSFGFKCWVTIQWMLLAFGASSGASIISPANLVITAYVGVGEEVGVLSVSLYVLGFAIGPCFLASISEIWGRRWSVLPAFFLLGIFSIATGVIHNAASLFIIRFLAGLSGSAPASNGAAALSDIWHQDARGVAFMFLTMCVTGGPTLGPVIGAGILSSSELGWRWIGYLPGIWVLAIFVICFFGLPETYGPVLLHKRAAKLRQEGGNPNLYHPHEELTADIRSVMSRQLIRPLVMLSTEPMVVVIALYASFVYGLLFMTFQVFPIVFQEHRSFTVMTGSLPFISLFIGVICALLILFSFQSSYKRKSALAKGQPVPEARLSPMALGGVIIVVGLFWFGWTASPKYHWALPVVAAVFIGCGFQVIFSQCVNFLVDTYGQYAASAVAANTFLRSVMAFSMPLFAKPMFHGLRVGPAMSILGGVASLALPAPFLLMRYSLVLRRKSKFAPVKD